MSYTFETEEDEILECGEMYYIDCPYCGAENIERRDVCSMPWRVDDEERIVCPKCNKNFEIRPKYRFTGFYIYTDDEQEG